MMGIVLGRRGWWWKIPLISIVTIFALIPIGLAIWSARERNAFESQIAALRAAGEPIDAADFATASVPDDENAVPLIRQAIAAYVRDAQRDAARREIEQEDDHAFTLPLTEAEAVLLRSTIDANRVALDALAGLDRRPHADWGEPWQSWLDRPSSDNTLSHFRELAVLLSDVARLSAHDGRWHEAIEALHDIPPLAEAAIAQQSMVDLLAARGIHALAAAVALEIAPDLKPGQDSERIRALIALLLAEDWDPRGLRVALQAERATVRLMIQRLSGSGTTRPSSAFTPFVYRSGNLSLRHFEEAFRLIDAPDYANYDMRAQSIRQLYDDVQDSRLMFLAAVFISPQDQLNQLRYSTLTDRRLAACALAIRLYQLDHGERPATLDALTPDYLPAVPLDALDGKPLRYDPSRAILWSVGTDGIDDAGNETPAGKRYEAWQTKDRVVHLDRRLRPATQPSLSPLPAD